MHIFISYAKADTRDLALQLRDAIIALSGVTTWMDTSLYSGEDWASQIQDEIDRADLVVVLLSQDVNRSVNHPNGRSFVLKEIHYAQQVKKTIIPIMAQMTRVPVQLAGIEYIDFTRDQSAGVQRLIREITTRAGIIPSKRMPHPDEPTTYEQRKMFVNSPSRQIILRPAFIIGLLVLAVIIVAAVILPSLNPPTLPTPTTNISLLPSDSPPPTLPTVTPTLTLTATSQPPTVTFTPNSPLAFTAIAHNADWTPISQTFNGVEMVLVPVGCFMMGSTDGSDDEKPVNQQCFDPPFWVDRYEVTNKQYGSEGYFKGDNRPREQVTWFAARDFCIARGARMPTEREWEYAARGPDNWVYPWGNDFVADNVVYSGNANNQTADVGSRPAGNSWVGASDLSGNVWEWVSSIYQPYPYKMDDGRELNNDSTDVRRGLRGGSWGYCDTCMRSASRYSYYPSYQDDYIGFRCVLSY